MSAGVELVDKDRWIFEQLSSSASLTALLGGSASPRIFSDLIPQGTTSYSGTAYDAIVFQSIGGEDFGPVNGARNMTRDLYMVKAVTQGPSYARGRAIMKLADPLLQGQQGTVIVSGGTAYRVHECLRIRAVKEPEILGGIEYRHLGGVYAIWGGEP